MKQNTAGDRYRSGEWVWEPGDYPRAVWPVLLLVGIGMTYWFVYAMSYMH